MPADGDYLNGKDGDLQINSCDVLHFTQWTLNYGANNDEFFARSGGGAAETTEGPASGSGNFEVIVPRGATHLLNKLTSGSKYAAVFKCEGEGGTEYSGNIRLGKFSTSANRGGPTQRMSFDFTTDGVMQTPADNIGP